MQAPEFLYTMKGPAFLGLYVLWFVVVFGIVVWLRTRGIDNQFVDFAGAAVFLGFGIIRLVAGSAHGMHKWGFLTFLMFVGAVVFFFRASTTSGGSSGSSGCGGGGGGCGGGSCGGGGCGGGGCGGCGGS